MGGLYKTYGKEDFKYENATLRHWCSRNSTNQGAFIQEMLRSPHPQALGQMAGDRDTAGEQIHINSASAITRMWEDHSHTNTHTPSQRQRRGNSAGIPPACDGWGNTMSWERQLEDEETSNYTEAGKRAGGHASWSKRGSKEKQVGKQGSQWLG